MSGRPTDGGARPFFCRIHLLVTGQAEAEHLPKLFSHFEATGTCHVRVERRVAQFSPRTSARHLAMVGAEAAGRLPTRSEEEISLPARRILRGDSAALVLLVDDLEYERRSIVAEVWANYRRAIDKLLAPDERARASVHFLANMLEAYFFADPVAVESALGVEVESPVEDVEEIPHPKNLLKQRLSSFRERRDGGKILEHLDLYRVLGSPDTCAWLRSCVLWLVECLRGVLDSSLHACFEEIETSCHLTLGATHKMVVEQEHP